MLHNVSLAYTVHVLVALMRARVGLACLVHTALFPHPPPSSTLCGHVLVRETPTARLSRPSARAARTPLSTPRPFRQSSTNRISTRQVQYFHNHLQVARRNIEFRAASQIVDNIQARTWTALAVLEAYIARAAQAHQATNCLTEGTYPSSRFPPNPSLH